MYVTVFWMYNVVRLCQIEQTFPTPCFVVCMDYKSLNPVLTDTKMLGENNCMYVINCRMSSCHASCFTPNTQLFMLVWSNITSVQKDHHIVCLTTGPYPLPMWSLQCSYNIFQFFFNSAPNIFRFELVVILTGPTTFLHMFVWLLGIFRDVSWPYSTNSRRTKMVAVRYSGSATWVSLPQGAETGIGGMGNKRVTSKRDP
jgi:hypothetical protein